MAARQTRLNLHTGRQEVSKMPKPKRPKNPSQPAMVEMSAAEAAVATLIAHGLDTVYALPGVHNDHLFDAFHGAGDALRVVHTRQPC